jgi:[ribosomal protein S5]-alanine N-acetyltransferase
MPFESLETERLILRLFIESDAPRVYELVRVAAVAVTSLNIPHPYPETLAAEWIKSQSDATKRGLYAFAVTQKSDGLLIGCVSLGTTHRHCRAELGYWIGQPFWGRGYATEAVSRVISWAFEMQALNRIFAQHFAGNLASGRVMQKCGLTYEGTLRDCVLKDGIYHDTPIYSILRRDFDAAALLNL